MHHATFSLSNFGVLFLDDIYNNGFAVAREKKGNIQKKKKNNSPEKHLFSSFYGNN